MYTWWGDRILRKICGTNIPHGLLHAALERAVSLWLDEGLAEYFEVAGASTPRRVNTDITQLDW